MSIEQALAENTAALKELTAALLAGGVVKNAQATAEAHSSPAVKAVVKAQKEADAANRKANPKGGEHESSDAAREAAQEQSRTASALAAAKKLAAQQAAEAAPSASGEPSAPTGESSSSEPTEGFVDGVYHWAGKTAAKYAELKDAAPDLENVRKAVLGINSLIGRDQATAVLGRFGVQAVTPKDNKKGLDESQYAEFLALCLEVLSGKVDATASMAAE
jgi:chemotaxis protein histidine kinase CheA